MRAAKIIGLSAIGIVLTLVGGLYAIWELGQEVVVLHRWSPGGEPDRIRMWIVDQGNHSWVHHGDPGAPWIRRLEEHPVVTLERSGATNEVRASADAEAHARVHQLVGEKYGRFARVLAPSPEDCPVLPVRLSPKEAGETAR